jgi:hypothetical protein
MTAAEVTGTLPASVTVTWYSPRLVSFTFVFPGEDGW